MLHVAEVLLLDDAFVGVGLGVLDAFVGVGEGVLDLAMELEDDDLLGVADGDGDGLLDDGDGVSEELGFAELELGFAVLQEQLLDAFVDVGLGVLDLEIELELGFALEVALLLAAFTS